MSFRSDLTLNAAAKTVTFTDAVSIGRVQLVVNITRTTLIYNFADPAMGGTLAGPVLTLEFDTSAMADSDVLACYYADTTTSATEATLADVRTAVALLATTVASAKVNVDDADTQTRLDTIAGKLDTLHADIDGLEGFTDGIEALIGTTNTTLATLNGYVDGLEALIGTGNTTATAIAGYVDQLEGYVDGLEALATSTNTKLDTLLSVLPTSLGAKTPAASLPVVQASATSTLQSAAGALGNGASLDVTGMSSVSFGVTISATATVTFEGTADVSGATGWVAITAIGPGPSGVSTSSISSSNTVVASTGGLALVRARISSFGSGTVTVVAIASAAAPRPYDRVAVAGAGAAGSVATGNPVLVGGHDGTNTRIPLMAQDNADALAVSAVNHHLRMMSLGYVFNGTSWDRLRSDGTTGGMGVGGTVASAATDSGRPVKVGGKYNLTAPTFTDGQRGDVQLDPKGSVKVILTDNSGATNSRDIATLAPDAMSTAFAGAGRMAAVGLDFNGATWDRHRTNTTGALIAAGATTTQTDIALTTYNARSLVLLVNVSAGAGSLIVTVKGKSTNYTYPLLISSSLTGVAVTPLRIGPGLSASPNAVANDVIPRDVTVTVAVTGSITFGVDYILGV